MRAAARKGKPQPKAKGLWKTEVMLGATIDLELPVPWQFRVISAQSAAILLLLEKSELPSIEQLGEVVTFTVIRIIADCSQVDTSGGEIATLEALSFKMKRMPRLSGDIMHNEFMIIDGKLLFTGSYIGLASAESLILKIRYSFQVR